MERRVTVTPDDLTPAFLRLFIAVAVPPDVRQEIARAQDQLRRNSPPGALRWTRPEQFHLTLKFLGDVPATQVGALENAVSAACAGFPVLPLAAHGLGFSPNEQRPRVIWAGVDDPGGQLAELHRRIEVAVLPFAPSPAPERFAGHITLGRFKPGYHGAMGKLLARATLLRTRHFGDWRAEQVDIIRSELTAAGARHTPLVSYRLSG